MFGFLYRIDKPILWWKERCTWHMDLHSAERNMLKFSAVPWCLWKHKCVFKKKWRGPKEVHRIYFDPCQLNTVRTLLSHWFLLNNLFNLFNWRLKKGAFTQSIAYLGTWSLRRVLGQLVKRSKLRVLPVLATGKEKVALAVEGEKGDLDNQNTQNKLRPLLKSSSLLISAGSKFGSWFMIYIYIYMYINWGEQSLQPDFQTSSPKVELSRMQFFVTSKF